MQLPDLRPFTSLVTLDVSFNQVGSPLPAPQLLYSSLPPARPLIICGLPSPCARCAAPPPLPACALLSDYPVVCPQLSDLSGVALPLSLQQLYFASNEVSRTAPGMNPRGTLFNNPGGRTIDRSKSCLCCPAQRRAIYYYNSTID